MRFKYAAKTRDGLSVRRGEVDSPDKESALKSLRDKDLIVYSLNEVGNGFDFFRFIPFISGISLSDKVRFTDQLASMTTAGLPLTKTLQLLVSQTKNKRLSELIQSVLNEVESGTPLHQSLAQRGDVFSSSYINLVKAGEASGKLDEVLAKLAESLEKQRAFRSKVKSALMYPAIITVVMAGVFVLVIVYLIPKMTTIYSSFDVDLPLSTRMLIKMSDFIIGFWWLVIIIIGALSATFIAVKSTPAGNRAITSLNMRIPLIGRVIREATVVEYTQSMALLIQAGVPLVDALEISRGAVSNILFKDDIGRFIEDVKHGYPLSQSMRASVYFPQFVSQMVTVGEETGTVDQRFKSLSAYYEGEVDKIVKNLSTAIEPLIMVLLGALVLILILSVLLPIYQLTNQFG